MAWTQVYDPLHNWILSTLVAALPILVLFGLLAGLRVKPHWCAIAGAGTAVLVAVIIFGMPVRLAGMSFVYGVGFGVLKIAWIVLAAGYLYDVSVHTGQFEIMKESVAGITADRRLQLLMVAFCFGAFIEGAAGFGAPVAIAGAFMIGLGFKPFHAAALNLLANTSPVAWGAIGTPVHTLAPHATGDVLASRLSAAAWNGLNPRPIMKAPAIATGAPNPAAPSMKAPKQNATSSSCNRRSAVMPATDSFMISNWPVNTEMSYRYTAASTIHAIFRTPNPTPYRKLMPASETGIPKTTTATSTAVPAPAIAHQWGFSRSPASRPKSTRIGRAATRVDRIQLCSGSYTWVHAMARSFARWASKTTPSGLGSQGARQGLDVRASTMPTC